jgi:hypothetical protein
VRRSEQKAAVMGETALPVDSKATDNHTMGAGSAITATASGATGVDLLHGALLQTATAMERPFCWLFFVINALACVAAISRSTLADVLVSAAAAALIAEAATSLFHYWGDRRVFVSWPLFCHYDRAYARHHRDPNDIVASGAMGYAQWVGDVALLPLCAPIWIALVIVDEALPRFALVLLFVCTLIAIAADTHRLAHCEPADVPWVARILQRAGLLLSASSHRKHHDLVRKTGRLGYFSVLTGWSNRAQDLAGLGDDVRKSR